jgi:hypothetical protein
VKPAVKALSGRMVPPPYGWDCWLQRGDAWGKGAWRYVFQQGVVLRIIRVRWEGNHVKVRAATQAFRWGWFPELRRWVTGTGSERYSDHPPLQEIPEEVAAVFRATAWHKCIVERYDGKSFPHRGWERK